jgi:hypothetical protein
MKTFRGHGFYATDATTLEPLVHCTASPELSVCLIVPLPVAIFPLSRKTLLELNQEGKSTQRTELERRLSNTQRIALNHDQPPRVPKFTVVGFDTRRLPAEAFDALSSYWEQHKDRQDLEAWPAGDAHVNHWESATFLVPLSARVKQLVEPVVQGLLEAWVGRPLEHTASYGLRVYTNGSWLMSHVDRVQTHAVSAIVNVAQAVSRPWPLQIYSHAGAASRVELQPGDVLLYESAACVHGREEPLFGDFYTNVFFHFRPLNWLDTLAA